MEKTKCDSKGRIYLREAVRSKYGRQFFVLEEPGQIVLRPVPEDPVGDLDNMRKALDEAQMKALAA